MKYTVFLSNRFKKDVERIKKRKLNIEELKEIVEMLRNGTELPPSYEDHALKGKWKAHRECHIRPDWLLIYQIKDDVLVLELSRTGTHSDLFGR